MTDHSTSSTTDADLEAILTAAAAAARPWGELAPAERAAALAAVAEALDVHRDELIDLAVEESHLTEGRLSGELDRTIFQLRLFTDVLADGGYLEAAIDPPDDDWPPGPRPDLRRMLLPLGPVVVFAASNFPFAFSVAGGDTASALAAGCPVVMKAHPGHPRLSVRTAAVVCGALADAGAHSGTFSVIFGEGPGRQALLDERIRAGAFTGSLRGGRALFDLATSRPTPIPFYGELGSLNPVFVTTSALAERQDDILAGYVESFTLGAGQFCTKPGLLFVPADRQAAVEEALTGLVADQAGAPLLNDRIQRGYVSGLQKLADNPAVRTLVLGTDAFTAEPTPALLSTTVVELLADRNQLLVECFGPASIVVGYADDDQLVSAASAFDGQLTTTVHGEVSEAVVPRLLACLTERAGRVVWNGWPTGVAVAWAMQHGGPYPATTAPLHTSVGTAAISRFLRPISYQSLPDELLPPALRDDNPLGIPRRTSGKLAD